MDVSMVRSWRKAVGEAGSWTKLSHAGWT